jgi:hypothetical protein
MSIIAIAVVVPTAITKEQPANRALFSRGVVLRNACQRYGIFEFGCQRRWPAQPICLARLSQEYWMEDVYYLHSVVQCSDSHHLRVVPRDQEQNCKFLHFFQLYLY